MKGVAGASSTKTMPNRHLNVMLFNPASKKGGPVGREGRRRQEGVRVFKSKRRCRGQQGLRRLSNGSGFLTQYREQVVPQLAKQFGYKSVMEVRASQGHAEHVASGEAIVDRRTSSGGRRHDQDRRRRSRW